ncbi:D-alanine--D-alanine ligase [Lactobacillus helveticus]|uniref:D-alanine--D-alanine ligase n=4 Tax=Lactobacillus helveticus TaxID=1587 RepID=DDL_LACH4|nr:D-alanine--D-alanine ligase family protein [Lactobacillus helveticus]A8YWP6.1 RecName: Full=D-alanine--D-alanine ligase; AltName: Full=D-Ala-D-Ala ligase; AltName: Full=D-alanylalanine synthetase [Lactobacillus helveticus DPC 4571]EGF36226.1 D-alanyl-alanine synthetase A [Lactobacillus helveticus MTCC 5463]ABX26408.1 D-alanine-D-alanine ligase [Lactobacillus helveticus DPC 4571]AGQ22754.1 D-alanine-D-alanine ligase Ddl [Lactobacillus helveticus CNRZ32]AJY60762.1 D-alanine--D-alanine ligase 
MTKKTQVGLIFGGNSSEYEVSIVSCRNIYKAIDKEKFDVHPIWITNEGYFANEEESFKVLEDPSYQVKNPHKVHNISNLIELENLPEIDVFFPIVHGNLGEDGVLQGLFRLMNKPFVGDDVLAAAVTMDKEFTKILAQRVGVPVADWITIKRFEYDDKNNDKLDYEKVAEKLGRDMFVKPSNQGSSVGVSHVTNADEYAAALKEAFKYDDKVLVEETVPGTEVETAVLGNDKPIVAGVGQITNAKGSFYSYKNKYDDNSTSKLQIPADLPQEIIDTVRRNARKVYEVTECSGMARIDSMLTPGGKVVLTEVNALPGFTNISMYPKLFEEAGVPYTELITRLIEVGMERFDHKKTLLHKHD